MAKITLYVSNSEKPKIDEFKKKLKEPLSRWFAKTIIQELERMNPVIIKVEHRDPVEHKIPAEEEADLFKIVETAEKLNAQANEATRYIEAVENRLNEAQVGKVVWLDSPGISDRVIGFAKVEGVWGIAVKPPERLIRNSDRITRIAAAPLIPELLKLIMKEMGKAEDTVKKGWG